MYEKIVVPLDGSKLAECVLPYVEELAEGCNVEGVLLVSVTEWFVGRLETAELREAYGDVTMGKKQRQAQRYLDRIAKRLAKKGINVQSKVLRGNPAEEIVGYAEQNNCSLIAMTSQGRSGINRWARSIGAFGGVADKVLRASSVPVLMVKASE